MTAASRALAVWCVVVASGGIARAEPSAAELFQEGRTLAKAGKHAEACEKFQGSQALDPQLGTLFNIAQCQERTGRLASAAAAYREVVARDAFAERKALAREYLRNLEPRVPRIVAQIAGPPAGLSLRLAGPGGARAIEPNRPIEVDRGAYTLSARAPGFRERSSEVTAREGVTVTVPVSLERAGARDDQVTAPPPEESPDAERRRSRRRLYGQIAVAAGGAAIITGLVFGGVAKSRWDDAQAVCGGTTCAAQEDVDRAQALVSDARSAGNVATVLVGGGVVIAAAGLVVWLTAPSGEPAVQVTASAAPTAIGFTVSGRF